MSKDSEHGFQCTRAGDEHDCCCVPEEPMAFLCKIQLTTFSGFRDRFHDAYVNSPIAALTSHLRQRTPLLPHRLTVTHVDMLTAPLSDTPCMTLPALPTSTDLYLVADVGGSGGEESHDHAIGELQTSGGGKMQVRNKSVFQRFCCY